jgi:hypothetical protein
MDTTAAVDDSAHRRPARAGDATVAAVGKLSEAVEWLERARGRLFDFHQMLGHVDFTLGDAADLLREAGHSPDADLVETELVGRNVLDGRWTYQVVEEFEDVYYSVVRRVEQQICDALMDGKRHVFEAELKAERRSRGRRGHDALPPAAHDPAVITAEHR